MRQGLLCTVAGATLAMAASGGAAAQEPLALFLSCSGKDVSYQQTGTDLRTPTQAQIQHNHAAGLPPPAASSTPRYGFVTSAGRMSVTVQGETVRVRPSAGAAPTLRKSGDGWYDLGEVHITESEIRARASWGFPGKLKLAVDRRSGEVKFGNFSGACEKASVDPEGRKF